MIDEIHEETPLGRAFGRGAVESGYDTLGACIFAEFGFAAAPEAIKNLLHARQSWTIGSDILQVLGEKHAPL